MPVRLKVKEMAHEKGFSQRQLYLRSGVDIKTLQRMYKDPYTVVTTETLGKIARVLGIDASDLLEGVSDDIRYDPDAKSP